MHTLLSWLYANVPLILIQAYKDNEHSLQFHSSSAMLELYRYACRYGAEISDAMTEDKVVLLAAQFNSLRQKFTLK